MIGLRGLAFLNHGEKQMDIQPFWIGVVVWTVIAVLVIVGIEIFG